VSKRQLGNVNTPVEVTHRAHQLPDADSAARGANLGDTLITPRLNGFNRLIETQPHTQVLFWCPANFAVDDAIVGEVENEFFRNAVESVGGLHHPRSDVKRFQVFDKRPGICLVSKPLGDFSCVSRREVKTVGGRQINDGLWSKTTIEMIMQGHFGKFLEVNVASGQKKCHAVIVL